MHYNWTSFLNKLNFIKTPNISWSQIHKMNDWLSSPNLTSSFLQLFWTNLSSHFGQSRSHWFVCWTVEKEDNASHDSIDQGENWVEIDVLFEFSQGSQDVWGKDHGQDEEQCPLHDPWWCSLALVHTLKRFISIRGSCSFDNCKGEDDKQNHGDEDSVEQSGVKTQETMVGASKVIILEHHVKQDNAECKAPANQHIG